MSTNYLLFRCRWTGWDQLPRNRVVCVYRDNAGHADKYPGPYRYWAADLGPHVPAQDGKTLGCGKRADTARGAVLRLILDHGPTYESIEPIGEYPILWE